MTQAHRSHVYQRLTQLGWTHLQSGATVAFASVMCCVLALLARWSLIPEGVCMASIALVLAAYLASPWMISRLRTDRASV